MISDNAPQFACEKFSNFAKYKWGFEHRSGSPGHQQTNGKAEAAVKEAKHLPQKAKASRGDLYLAVLAQQNTPTESVGTSPAQLLLGRQCKTQLPTTKELPKPHYVRTEAVKKEIRAQKERQAKYYNKRAQDLSSLEEGAVVRMRPFTLGKKVWKKAMVTKCLDEQSYKVETKAGTYRWNTVDLKEQSLPRPLEQNPTPAVTPDKEKT